MITTQDIADVNEDERFSRSFDYSLESNSDSGNSNEQFVSFEIIMPEKPDTIIIDNNRRTISGVFHDVVDLGPNALRYRIGPNHFSTGKFSELPPKGTAILYEYNPPREIKKDFTIECVLTTKVLTREKTYRKTFTLTVWSDYMKFARRLRDYCI